MRLLRGLIVLCWGLVGCASGPGPAGEPANYGLKDGLVWVRGPWEAIKPSRDPDEVIDQLCPAVMELPGARFGDYGREYCGLVYSLGDGTYYASYPSPLANPKPRRSSRDKACYVPQLVVDQRGAPAPLADYHGHPWSPSSMLDSKEDLLGATQVFSIRIQFDKVCHLQKLIPYLKEDRPGELYERRGKSWKLIGLIKPENKASGRVTPVNE
ncbi:MAG: hypothetical protein ACJ8AT_24070 [Hyalangium sp.]|uniref:hypothetical protein n=1 Tax=Hyalangium sp. TaxID=2028555 RepID=UPI003899A480